jgi:hypothetical protein
MSKLLPTTLWPPGRGGLFKNDLRAGTQATSTDGHDQPLMMNECGMLAYLAEACHCVLRATPCVGEGSDQGSYYAVLCTSNIDCDISVCMLIPKVQSACLAGMYECKDPPALAHALHAAAQIIQACSMLGLGHGG